MGYIKASRRGNLSQEWQEESLGTFAGVIFKRREREQFSHYAWLLFLAQLGKRCNIGQWTHVPKLLGLGATVCRRVRHGWTRTSKIP